MLLSWTGCGRIFARPVSLTQRKGPPDGPEGKRSWKASPHQHQHLLKVRLPSYAWLGGRWVHCHLLHLPRSQEEASQQIPRRLRSHHFDTAGRPAGMEALGRQDEENHKWERQDQGERRLPNTSA